MIMPEIDHQKCDGCGLCLSVCQCGSLALVGNKAVVLEKKECDWCTLCEAVCPQGAISCFFEIIIEG